MSSNIATVKTGMLPGAENNGNGTPGTNGAGGQGNGNNTEQVSIFAKLDTNTNNTIEKSEASGSIEKGFTDNSSSIFNNIMQSVVGQDAPAIKSRADDIKPKETLQNLYNKYAEAFADKKLEATTVKSGDNKAKESAQTKIDNDVNTYITNQINDFNKNAQTEYTGTINTNLQKVTQEVQQERIETTFSPLDNDNNHSVDVNEAKPLMQFDTSSLNLKGLTSGNPDNKTLSLNINQLLDESMQSAMSMFNSVDATTTIPETNDVFNKRVEGNVNSQVENVQTNLSNDIQKKVADILKQIQQPKSENQNKNSNATTDQYQSTRSNLESQGARFERTTVNGKEAEIATFKNDRGELQRIMINPDGTTKNIVTNGDNGIKTDKQVIEAQDNTIDLFNNNSNVNNLQVTNPNAKGADIHGTYQDNDNRNHSVTFTPNMQAGTNNVQIVDTLTGSNDNENHTSVYDLAQQKTGIDKNTLNALQITPELKNDQIIYKDQHGKIISEAELMQMTRKS